MSTPKLFAYKNSINLLRIKAVAKLSKFELVIEEIENSVIPKDVVEKSPTNTYPYLETSEGILSECNAICLYIAGKSGFAGSSDYEKAQVLQWIAYSIHEINSNKLNTVYAVFGFFEFDNEKNKSSTVRVTNNLKSLEKHLTGKSYLVGNKLSLADIELWAALKHFWQFIFVDAMRNKLFPNIEAWFVRVSNVDEVKKTFGLTHLCKVALKAPKVEKKVEKKEEKPKEDKPKEEKPVEEKPKAEVFPESKLDFDGFKKKFMNSTDRKAVLDEFFNGEYDPKAFSIHYLRYQKLPSEGKILFKTTNGRDGFIERTEVGRKHVFSSFGVYGEEGNYEIKGVWLWRGLNVPQFLLDNPQFEYYDRVTLDPSNPKDKERIYNYWLNLKEGDEVEGLKAVDVITFK